MSITAIQITDTHIATDRSYRPNTRIKRIKRREYVLKVYSLKLDTHILRIISLGKKESISIIYNKAWTV